jgi:hypothetical protein
MRPEFLCLIALVLLAAPVAHAQPFDPIRYESDPFVALNLHLTEADYALGCDAFDDAAVGVCENLESDPMPGEAAFLWIVLSYAGGFPDGVGGVEFGIEFEDIGTGGWALCTGGLEIPSDEWPASVSGNAITWEDGCYAPVGEVAKVGYFIVTDGATGSMQVIGDPRLVPPEALFADCSVLDDGNYPEVFTILPENLGGAELADGTIPACPEPPPTPIQTSSWGRVKELYR